MATTKKIVYGTPRDLSVALTSLSSQRYLFNSRQTFATSDERDFPIFFPGFVSIPDGVSFLTGEEAGIDVGALPIYDTAFIKANVALASLKITLNLTSSGGTANRGFTYQIRHATDPSTYGDVDDGTLTLASVSPDATGTTELEVTRGSVAADTIFWVRCTAKGSAAGRNTYIGAGDLTIEAKQTIDPLITLTDGTTYQFWNNGPYPFQFASKTGTDAPGLDDGVSVRYRDKIIHEKIARTRRSGSGRKATRPRSLSRIILTNGWGTQT